MYPAVIPYNVGKYNNKPPIWEWFIPPIYGDLGDGSLLLYPHYHLVI